MFIRSWSGYSSLLATGLLSACQHAAIAPLAANASAAAPGTPAARVVPVVTAAATPTASTPEAPDASPFVEGVRLGYAARLTVTGAHAFLSTPSLLLGIHDDSVAIEPALLEGLHPGRSPFPRLFGNMPDSGWALEEQSEERTVRNSLSRWTGSEWVSANALLNGRNVIGISAWSAGRSLALVADGFSKQLAFVQLGGARGVPVPELPYRARSSWGCVHGLQPSAMSALPSGEVFLAGTLCTVTDDENEETHGVALERWNAGQARGKVTVLPRLSEQEAASGEVASIVATSASDVFVAGTRVRPLPAADAAESNAEAYVAHFDGRAWRALPAPPIDRIDELQRTPEGTLWALTGGDLWATTGPASETSAWERVALPRFAKDAGEHAVTSFWVQGPGEVWATIGAEDYAYLVRTKRGSAPLSAPPDAELAELSRSLDPATAYDCEAPTLLLLTLSHQAPENADAPSVRAALRGHAELEGKAQLVELSFLTRRYLALRGDRDGLQRAGAILEQSHLPGVAPLLRCLNAAPTRTLSLDFAREKPSAQLRGH